MCLLKLFLCSLALIFPMILPATVITKKSIDEKIIPIIGNGPEKVPNVVIGMIHDGKMEFFSYGNSQINENSIFKIGSVQKIFAGFLLAQMVKRKEVTLNSPINEFLPSGLNLPQYKGKSIKLWHLATHTAGFPKADGQLGRSLERCQKREDVNKLMDNYLSHFKLDQEPGLTSSYSNIGAALLANILSRKQGRDYGEILREDIFLPLGMVNSYASVPLAKRKNIVQGHNQQGIPLPIPLKDDLSMTGSSQLHSSAHDLLLFLKAHLNNDQNSPLHQEILLSQEIIFSKNKKKQMAYLWDVNDGDLYSKNGHSGEYGFHAHAFFHKQKKIALVILANAATNVSPIAQEIFREMIFSH